MTVHRSFQQFLAESPFLDPRDAAPTWTRDASMSANTMTRQWTMLGSLSVPTVGLVKFWLRNDLLGACVTDDQLNDIGNPVNRILTDLVFQLPAGLPVENELHVSTVKTHPIAQGQFLAGMLYMLIASKGYSVVSDFKQFNGGKKLWQKLASEAIARQYLVRVWDDEEQDWVLDATGEPIRYNVANLADDKVWKHISLSGHEATTLLALTKL